MVLLSLRRALVNVLCLSLEGALCASLQFDSIEVGLYPDIRRKRH